ncbi:16S rRNA (cytosine(1402)-N(4))-methyltransferase RsmH [Metamycoplasma hyosynoviae]|uniref:16S rRNA (cytosine(1402)-N(4))-methyltransferase RsmH n=1 Tax=Metamycoplasma hyosynoviae TaxID=29559 RepID=UPI002359AEFF|nr:16S rRNA (cytosine(1402)-N(4))-methyltransferase RsmH [Metamycoplasma hyosynoviae]MDC8927308.1 16S rRNA (cytosine(1402)-N(4))-methyltransferase RsmH [Metamycoplasma hyosynoviae]MDD1360627.1 16S rRNA (cytosine(1402)-N(4))-methyltransferase RsmH [Metamycoplasma hyosynoviae]MDD1362195.1 16S rRNA (cytosine(1402)-N(4))-methyltransferase RsmH [Metamycoplasma hyosynoviae]MDD7897419.1 16S rRNA (cytosine(1402)-N(4))-methyltransferase RsmH [Metamycoplasma hyosynoviae]
MHIPVLLQEVIDYLEIKADGVYVDLTLGRAGHSQEILKKIKNGKLICFDKDIEAINASQKLLEKINSNFVLIKSDFKNLKEELEKLNIAQVDGILVDLGVSSPQLDTVERGFSYSVDSPLDMRMDRQSELKASDIVNNYPQEELEKILIENADVKFFKKIAKAIIENRPFESSKKLVDVIKQCLPAFEVRKKNPAKQIFQALRMEVNDELGALKTLLKQIPDLLKENGKFLAISFHSKEDKLIKEFYQKLNYEDPKIARLPISSKQKWSQKIVFPSEEEKNINKRSQSAKLRIISKR